MTMSGTLAAVAMDTGEVHLCDALQVRLPRKTGQEVAKLIGEERHSRDVHPLYMK